jgi:hypothetical protein
VGCSRVCGCVQATVVLHFGDRDEWTVPELAEATGLPEATLVQKLNFWVQNGIVLKHMGSAEGATGGVGDSAGAAAGAGTGAAGGGPQVVVYVAAKTFVDGAMEVGAPTVLAVDFYAVVGLGLEFGVSGLLCLALALGLGSDPILPTHTTRTLTHPVLLLLFFRSFVRPPSVLTWYCSLRRSYEHMMSRLCLVTGYSGGEWCRQQRAADGRAVWGGRDDALHPVRVLGVPCVR